MKTNQIGLALWTDEDLAIFYRIDPRHDRTFIEMICHDYRDADIFAVTESVYSLHREVETRATSTVRNRIANNIRLGHDLDSNAIY